MYAGFAGATTGHRCPAFSRSTVIDFIRVSLFFVAFTPLARDHECPMLTVRRNKIVGIDFEQPKAGPKGEGRDTRSNAPW
jgi:hypothetical protein